MKNKIKQQWRSLSNYHNIIFFMVILIVSHFFWKFTVKGLDGDVAVSFLGINISLPFTMMSEHIRDVVVYVLKDWLGIHLHAHGDAIHFQTGNLVHIVWACSGLKQMYIFFCLIAFYKGSFINKLWYIPVGLIAIYLFNLMRILLLTFLSKDYIHQVPLFHEHIFKYLFYGFIFMLWMIWDIKFSKKNKI